MKSNNLAYLIFAIFSLALVPCYKAAAQRYVPVPAGSILNFEIKMMDFELNKHNPIPFKAMFNEFSGDIIFDPSKLKTAAFDITINTKNMKCSDSKINKELKSDSFFNVNKYTTIKIKSDSIFTDMPGSVIYQMLSHITIKGITIPIKIQFMATPLGTGYLFRGTFSINRKTFNLGENEHKYADLPFFIEMRTIAKS
jgi:polyisoprenoid-binding protein YceI